MGLELVRSLWIGNRLPPAQRACIASFVRVGHSFELFTYDEVKGVPAGVRIRDAESIVPRDRIFRYGAAAGRSAGSLSGFSNLFRYAMLEAEGGYWVDTDTFCLQPFPADELVISSELRGDGSQMPNCGVLKCPPGHAFAQYCLARSERADPATMAFGQTGPALTGEAVRALGLEEYVLHPHAICSVSWFEHEQLCLPGTLPDAAVGLHLWSERWRLRGTDIPWPGPADSILGILARGEARAGASGAQSSFDRRW